MYHCIAIVNLVGGKCDRKCWWPILRSYTHINLEELTKIMYIIVGRASTGSNIIPSKCESDCCDHYHLVNFKALAWILDQM